MVTPYVSFCENACIPAKTRVRYSDDKPGFNAELKQLCHEKELACRSGDKDLYKKAKYSLEKEIRAVKNRCSGKLEEQFTVSGSS